MAAWSSDDIVDTKPNLTMHPPLRVGSHVFNSPEEFKKMLNMARGSKHEPVLRNAALASKNPAYTRLLEPEVLRKVEQMMSFTEWKNFKLLDSLKETEAVYDGSKPTTFNWWGAVGLKGGKVIDGEVPVGKKKKHGSRKK
jgi:hypothetical protein